MHFSSVGMCLAFFLHFYLVQWSLRTSGMSCIWIDFPCFQSKFPASSSADGFNTCPRGRGMQQSVPPTLVTFRWRSECEIWLLKHSHDPSWWFQVLMPSLLFPGVLQICYILIISVCLCVCIVGFLSKDCGCISTHSGDACGISRRESIQPDSRCLILVGEFDTWFVSQLVLDRNHLVSHLVITNSNSRTEQVIFCVFFMQAMSARVMNLLMCMLPEDLEILS